MDKRILLVFLVLAVTTANAGHKRRMQMRQQQEAQEMQPPYGLGSGYQGGAPFAAGRQYRPINIYYSRTGSRGPPQAPHRPHHPHYPPQLPPQYPPQYPPRIPSPPIGLPPHGALPSYPSPLALQFGPGAGHYAPNHGFFMSMPPTQYLPYPLNILNPYFLNYILPKLLYSYMSMMNPYALRSVAPVTPPKYSWSTFSPAGDAIRVDEEWKTHIINHDNDHDQYEAGSSDAASKTSAPKEVTETEGEKTEAAKAVAEEQPKQKQ
ncbi:uncharacterized protein LOC129751844 [Uranotaenia lowii]|uniref:uncharacterized protein LOC129751844 n=1 Tax=Uranotaenia lowii TaxID=190385 RepID=UPI0024798669|nr:uncharacterized protein LOC129751844 [Uranotaenia lowii]